MKTDTKKLTKNETVNQNEKARYEKTKRLPQMAVTMATI